MRNEGAEKNETVEIPPLENQTSPWSKSFATGSVTVEYKLA